MPPKRKLPPSSGEGGQKKQSRLTQFVKVTGADGKEKPASTLNQKGDIFLADLISDSSWKKALQDELTKPYVREIEKFLAKEYKAGKEIFPPRALIFNAFNSVPLNKVRVVILGQDPYHDVGQKGVTPPPSLKNIFKELSDDIPGFRVPNHGCLQVWADRGVFLPNAALTVEAHKANSHAKTGWHRLTDAAISALSDAVPHAVFILWGGFAQKKEPLIDASKHTVIKTAHPSPLSAAKFFGCKCFSKANSALKGYGLPEMDWSIP